MNSLLKTHKALFLVIIGLFNVIAYSQEKPIKHLYSQSIKVDQSADKVWNSITDVSQWNKWDKEVVDAKFNGLIDKKGVGNLIIPNGSVVDFEVVADDSTSDWLSMLPSKLICLQLGYVSLKSATDWNPATSGKTRFEFEKI